ncbi:MAG: biotin--[acetyl-CoA-carboxylase] ligase [Planctomycetes bacterium]|nr:biotin--[acetyl-CoA-carboxylase] ligase [Planctomycetota bacterium]
MVEAPIEQWTTRLESALDGDGGRAGRVIVLRETDSTQDAAKRLNAKPADIVVAWRQTAGHGRLGRTWADTHEQGIAATIVAERAPSERLAITCAVGVAQAAEALLGRSVGIKWPNDIVVDGRKLAGVLIEQSDQRALIGIGMNVLQTHWPHELAGRAVSLVQLGARVDRIDALVALLRAMNRALRLSQEQLIAEFSGRDVLQGVRATFRTGLRTVTGTVIETDPMRGLVVRTDADTVYLHSATTTLLSD